MFVCGDERIVRVECRENDGLTVGTIRRNPLDESEAVVVTELHVDDCDVVLVGKVCNRLVDRRDGGRHVDVLFSAECEGQSLREEIVVVAQEDPNCSRRDFQGASPPDDRTGPYCEQYNVVDAQKTV